MTRMTPSEFAREVGAGLLSFPVSCFNPGLSFNERGYNVAGLFAAGGTGDIGRSPADRH